LWISSSWAFSTRNLVAFCTGRGTDLGKPKRRWRSVKKASARNDSSQKKEILVDSGAS
jgi:altronate dehydratase